MPPKSVRDSQCRCGAFELTSLFYAGQWLPRCKFFGSRRSETDRNHTPRCAWLVVSSFLPNAFIEEIYAIATRLWSRHQSCTTALTQNELACLSPFLQDLLVHPLLPPGMPYQRQKTLIKLIANIFELSFISESSKNSLKRSGFEPCKSVQVFLMNLTSQGTAQNLQLILNRLIDQSGFPSPNEQHTWVQLLASLPNVNSEVSFCGHSARV